MKTIFTFLFVLFLFALNSSGQTVTASKSGDAPGAWSSTWYFCQTPATYTTISDGTTLGTIANDEDVFGTYDIGFNFSYNGNVYTKFSVATNGFIGLGNTAVTIATLPISAGASNNVISALGMNLAGQTGSDLQYKLIGSSPNRTMVIQWTTYCRSGITGDNFNFQIRLNENNNSVVFSYGDFVVATGVTTAQVGLRGASASEFKNRSVIVNNSTSTIIRADWRNSTTGATNDASCRVRPAAYPLTGQTYGWTPHLDQTAALPMSENFDIAATGTLPVGWSVENTNGDEFQWGSGAWYPNSNPNSMFISYNIDGTTVMNDWFFSPKVDLTVGHTYRVSFYYTNAPSTTSYREKLEVKFGDAATAAGMTSAAIFSDVNVNSTSYILGSATFEPTATGSYYLGWHGFSAANKFLLLVDDILIEEVFNDDVGSYALINPLRIPDGQLMPWFGKVKNNGINTETFPVRTKLRENDVLASTQTNTVTNLTANSTSRLAGFFNLASYSAASIFDLSLETRLTGDQNPTNNLLTQYTKPCVKDTSYAWDDGVSEGSVGYNNGSGWLGQLYVLTSKDTLTSITVKWGTIPGALAGNSVEIFYTSGGIPEAKLGDIATGISLAAIDANTWHTYKAISPIILPAGVYWIGVHQSNTLAGTYLMSDDQTGFNAESFLSGIAFYSADGAAWTDYSTGGLNMFNLIRPNFGTVTGVMVEDPTSFVATPVSSSEIDLGWGLNGNGNNVLVAWNTTNIFGVPMGGAYVPGNAIAGGGSVLQFTNSTSFNHIGRDPNTIYYYKAWSYDGTIYSGGVTTSSRTLCVETPAPWSESFEESTFPPTCWRRNVGSGTWTRSTAASSYGTGTGSAFASFFNISGTVPFALTSLPFNKGSMIAPALAFDYAYATKGGEVDEMDIYYSTDGGLNFQLLLAMPGGTTGILNTAGSSTAAFVPTAEQWATQTMILPIGTNMVAFNAISANGNNLYLDNIRIVEGLLDDVGVSSLDPVDVHPVETFSPAATVKNYGGSIETFDVTMSIGSYNSTRTVSNLAPGLTYQVNFDPWSAETGTYTETVTTTLAGDLDPANNTLSKPIKVMNLNKVVYGYTTFSSTDNGPVTFNLSTPGTLTELVNEYPVTSYPGGGTWANDKWYASIYSTVTPYNLVTFDPVTGARTVIGDMGLNLNALSYNKSNSTLYGAGYDGTNSILYTINLTTGTASLVGTIGTPLIINMAIDNAGTCYATDLTTDVLGTIDLTTAAFTPIGSIGFNANNAQDMEFDRKTNELYMAAYGTTGQLRWVDKTTGNTLLIGEFAGGAEITGFAIPYITVPENYTATGTVNGTQCFNATNTVTVGSTGTPFVVTGTGIATIYAGTRIHIVPNATVQAGGYLLCKIQGTYCSQPDEPLVAATATGQQESLVVPEQDNFTIYPNPTSGNFTIVQKGDKLYGNMKLEIYSSRGDKVISENITGLKKHDFRFAEMPDGIYFVKVVADDYVETMKLVKTR